MTDEEKIYIAYGETMHTLQLLELQFESLVVFVKIPEFDDADSFFEKLRKWQAGTLKNLIRLAKLPGGLDDLAVEIADARNRLAHEFLRDTVPRVQNDPRLLGSTVADLNQLKMQAERMMQVLMVYTKKQTEGYNWQEIQLKMNRGG